MEVGAVSFRLVITLIVAVPFAVVFMWPDSWMDHIRTWSFRMDHDLTDDDRQFQVRGMVILFFLISMGLIWGLRW